jgi:hypothetical protein
MRSKEARPSVFFVAFLLTTGNNRSRTKTSGTPANSTRSCTPTSTSSAASCSRTLVLRAVGIWVLMGLVKARTRLRWLCRLFVNMHQRWRCGWVGFWLLFFFLEGVMFFDSGNRDENALYIIMCIKRLLLEISFLLCGKSPRLRSINVKMMRGW